MELEEISKSQIVKVDRLFNRGMREIIATPLGKYDILKPFEIFTVQEGDEYIAYEILPNGVVEKLNKGFKLKV